VVEESVAAPADDFEEWVIETVGESDQASSDLALENKDTRKAVLIELDELIEFATYYEEADAQVAQTALRNLTDAQFLITLHEQPGSLERLTLKFTQTRDSNFKQQEAKLSNYEDLAAKSKASAHDALKKVLGNSRKLVATLTELMQTLFVNARVKLVGDLIAEIN
jgi:hypothetical protein